MPPSLLSDVWKHFTRGEDKKTAKFNLCHTDLAYSGGTSNLRSHLRMFHFQLNIITQLYQINDWVSKSLESDDTPSYTASLLDPSYLHITKSAGFIHYRKSAVNLTGSKHGLIYRSNERILTTLNWYTHCRNRGNLIVYSFPKRILNFHTVIRIVSGYFMRSPDSYLGIRCHPY